MNVADLAADIADKTDVLWVNVNSDGTWVGLYPDEDGVDGLDLETAWQVDEVLTDDVLDELVDGHGVRVVDFDTGHAWEV
ncbi:hypothetical protein FB384_004924 [Prauserella sediminis]|uniref:Uncharacterized protein n=1 Tax=Prauserella sediminis TaxID=577680 RepID=A0A839Y232_9PSEU|nr:hypothetical protein [Prauserella sediminis]MBB3665965.1 hypothetical protein [Prauserella sediminis]